MQIFEDIKNIINKDGYIVYFKFEYDDALWNSGIKYFEEKEKALEYRNFLMKMEMAGIDTEIEKLQEIKSNIQLVLKNNI